MYTTYYKLREEPFRITPDPRFLHMSQPHRQALLSLLQGVLGRRGFLLMTGPVGTGKTTLMHTAVRLLGRVSGGRSCVSAFLVNPVLRGEEFLDAVLDEFDVPCTSTSKPRRLMALYDYLLENSRQGGTAVLIIDEAHLLPSDLMEEIRLLSNFETHTEKPLQIVLCGQPELADNLRLPQWAALRQRIAVRVVLRELTLAETRGYITQRLQTAGLTGSSPFKQEAVDAIYKYSRGVPRVVNLLGHDVLSIGADMKLHEIGEDVVEKAARSLDLIHRPEIVSVAAASAGTWPGVVFAAPGFNESEPQS